MKWIISALIDQSLDRLDMERKRERQIYEMVNSSLDRSIFRQSGERERERERGTERQIYEMVNSSLDRSIFRQSGERERQIYMKWLERERETDR